MNKKKRDRNRENYRMLKNAVFICPNCGMRGKKHWVQTQAFTLDDMV